MKDKGGRNPYRRGCHFQSRVKKALEADGWNVMVRPKSAFPDILCWRRVQDGGFTVWMVECKVGKYLSKQEKEKIHKIGESVCDEFVVAWRDKNNKIIFTSVREVVCVSA